MQKIKSVLVANRGEIAIRVFRACNELGIRTVAIYSKEDTLSLHRNKADEAYLVGEGKGPIDAYLDIEDIIRIAHEHDVDAIHPGYGFLSENSDLAKRCAEEGIIFIGPRLEHLIMFGDKVNAREQAKLAGIPMIPGSDGPVDSIEDVYRFVQAHGIWKPFTTWPSPKLKKLLAAMKFTLKNIWKVRNILKYRFWAIRRATLCICSSVTAPYSDATRNW